MLRPIPRRILSDNAILKIPTSIDIYQNPIYETYNMNNIHVQNTNQVIKNTENTEVVLRAVLFFDCRLSSPIGLDIWSLERDANKVSASMKVEYAGDTYTVESVDLVPDDCGNPHHYELGMV
ncbi:putative minor capsid protein [Massilicoli timonensis]|uniref:putative minor capsid protein n=1 Tax=Massilicoli timonensis TaxID=2015901 RepID=UPI003AAE2E47